MTNVYFAPFTNPTDSTPRRPLVERVAGCRPTYTTDDAMFKLTQGHVGLIWLDLAQPMDTHHARTDEAIALCYRAAAEWLIGEGYHCFEWDHNSNTDTVTLRLYAITGRGTCMDTAIVAACHAVADAMGVGH